MCAVHSVSVFCALLRLCQQCSLSFPPSSGLVMIGVIIMSRKVGINPDNVATPIAASLGDLITLSLLSGVSSTLFEYRGVSLWMAFWISAFFVYMHILSETMNTV